MKKKQKQKYMLFGQADDDNKPFLCYKLPNMLMPREDSSESNQYSGENCLMTRKQALKAMRILSTNFPDTSYGIKKFLS